MPIGLALFCLLLDKERSRHFVILTSSVVFWLILLRNPKPFTRRFPGARAIVGSKVVGLPQPAVRNQPYII